MKKQNQLIKRIALAILEELLTLTALALMSLVVIVMQAKGTLAQIVMNVLLDMSGKLTVGHVGAFLKL